MVSSMTKKIISLAISLLVVVISLTGVALGATAPSNVTKLSRYTPGFAGAPGKMARDAAGNFYATDFWGKRIVKLDRQGNKVGGFIATQGRPSAVAVLPDNRLVVAMIAPQPYVAFYSQVQTGSAANVTVSGAEKARFENPAPALFRPVGITVDAAGFIYVVDAGDTTNSATVNVGKVRVYSPAGAYLYAFGTRTNKLLISTTGGEFKQPMGIAYEKQKKRIAVADTMNSRIQVFGRYSSGACAYVGSVGNSMFETPAVGSAVKLGDPTDLAFEYNGANLYRMYVTERGRNEISAVNMEGVTLGDGNPSCPLCTDLMRINGTTVTNAGMKHPAGILFEKTAIGGVLYTNNAPTSLAADILAIGIDNGTVPLPNTLQITSTILPTVTSSALTVGGTVSPVAAVTCSVNGGTGVDATGTSPWSASITLQPDDNYILCRSTSGGVTTYAEAYTFNAAAQTPEPTVIITQPGAGLNTKDATVTVRGTSNTANASMTLVNSLNGKTVTTATDAAKNWSAVVELAEGSNLVTVSAWTPGSYIGTATRTVNYDKTVPTLAIAFLANGTVTNNAIQNLDGIVTETSPLSSIEVNGVAVPASARVSLPDGRTYFSAPVTLVRGSNDVTVKATDLAGNVSVPVVRTVKLNPEKPGIAVAFPADNSYLPSTGSPAASGTADSGFFTAVNAYAVSGVTWSGTLAALSDFREYLFSTTGGDPDFPITGIYPNVSVKRSINANSAYALLAITSPPQDMATNQDSVIIAGSVAALSAKPKISIDGATAVDVSLYDSGNGGFSHTVSLLGLEQGTHSVRVIANAATTAVRNIVYDTNKPELAIQADSKAMPSTITGTIEPSAKISAITVTGGPAIPLSVIAFENPVADSVVWRASVSGYAFDTISFTTVDPAGNEKTLFYGKGVPTGDVDNDGVVRLSDALAALRHVAGTQLLVGEPLNQADVGSLVEKHAARDGVIDITDAVLILGKAYGLLTF